MLDQITSLSSAIDIYRIASESGEDGGRDIRSIVGNAVESVWDIVSKNGATISGVMDSFHKSDDYSIEEYKARITFLQKSVTKGDFGEFSRELLVFFGISNPEMFILRGKINPIVKPIIETKIHVSTLLENESKRERSKPKVLPDLEGITAIISSYNPIYEALIDKKTSIHTIIQNELIAPIAEEAPFIQRQYGSLIAGYNKKESKLTEILDLERKIVNLGILKKRGMTNDIKKAELLISKKTNELFFMVDQIKKIKDPFSLDDIVIYIQRKFGYYIKKKKVPKIDRTGEIITSQKIKGKIRRGISIGVHRNEELRQIRVNVGSMIRLIKMYEKIIEKYTTLSSGIDNPQEKVEIRTNLMAELDTWEIESNSLLDKYSLADIRRLRDFIIKQLLSKK